MPQGFSSPIDTGLPENPVDVPDDFYEVIQSIFNAIRQLQYGLGTLTGAQTQDTTSFLAVSQQFKDTVQVGRMQVIQVYCAMAIPAGSMVNLYDAGGNLLRARLAQATGMGTRAHGYVDQSYNNGDLAAIYLWAGYLGGSGFNAGTTYYLSATSPGAITSTPPTTAGMIRQEVGVGLGLSDFAVKIATPVQL